MVFSLKIFLSRPVTEPPPRTQLPPPHPPVLLEALSATPLALAYFLPQPISMEENE